MKTINRIKKKDYLLGIFILLLISSCTNSHRYQFTIVDDTSGEQISARVSLTDGCGKTIDIDGDPTHVKYMGKQWCYTDGAFSITSEYEDITFEVQQGIETLPLNISINKKQKEQVIKLKRWIDMRQKGYLCGDVHIHTPFSETAHLQMKAEDLDVVNLLLLEDSAKFTYFTGDLDPASSPGHSLYVDQEVRDWQMGHLTLVNLSAMVPNYYPDGGNLHSFSNHPHWLLSHAMDEAHSQEAIVIWSHFTNLPGSESPIAIALGKIDAIELMTYDDPTHLPSHQDPWNNSQMSNAEFPVMNGVNLYYQYLNAGFHLSIVAGTDKMNDDIPMGSNRYYADTKGDKTYEAYLAAIKSGSGFITNGPMLSFQVDGLLPGEKKDFQNSIKVHASFSVQSALPFATIEIIVNGMTAVQKTIYTGNNPPINGVYTMELQTDLVLEKSSWIAARVADDPDNKHRILPRELSVFAHTNPIYFLKDGKEVNEKASIEYLQTYVKGTINWLKTNPPFNHPEDHAEALKLAEQAYSIYESLKK